MLKVLKTKVVLEFDIHNIKSTKSIKDNWFDEISMRLNLKVEGRGDFI